MVAVIVADGYAVSVGGVQHPGGSRVELDRATADRYLSRGWVQPAKPAATAPVKRPVKRAHK